MALGILNIVQIGVYGAQELESSSYQGPQALILAVLCIAGALQIAIVALTSKAYTGFGWRMFSKMASDVRLQSAEDERMVAKKLNWFSALVKIDLQFLTSYCIVIGVNGGNPSGAGLIPAFISLSISMYVFLGGWLFMCHRAVMRERVRLALAADITMPVAHVCSASVVALAFHYRSSLDQAHGFGYLIFYSVLFLIGRTAVSLDSRLLSKRFGSLRKGAAPKNSHSNAADVDFPEELLPLMKGAWLQKTTVKQIEALTQDGCTPSAWFICAGTGKSGEGIRRRRRGGGSHWRFFQLSHDGSTLRWDWEKYVLLMHVESITCRDEDLIINLSFTLDPDLILAFPTRPIYDAWRTGLLLLMRLLASPDGVKGNQHHVALHMTDIGNCTVSESPSRRLMKTMSLGSSRACAGGLDAEQLAAAAEHARRAFASSGADKWQDRKQVNLQVSAGRLLRRPLSPSTSQEHTTTTFHSGATEGSWVRRALSLPLAGIWRGDRAQQKVNKKSYSSPTKVPLRSGDEDGDSTSPPQLAEYITLPGTLGLRILTPRKTVLPGKRTDRPPPLPPLFIEDTPHHHQLQPSSPLKRPLRQDSKSAFLHLHAIELEGSPNNTSPLSRRRTSSLAPHYQADSADNCAATNCGVLLPMSGITSTSSGPPSAGNTPRHNPQGLYRTGSQTLAWPAITSRTPAIITSALGAANPTMLSRQVSIPVLSRTPSDASIAAPLRGQFPSFTTESNSSPSKTPMSIIKGWALSASVEMIPWESLTMGKLLGEGGEGPVHAAWYQETPVAVKKIASLVEVEMNLHAGNHDNVVGLRGVSQRGNDVYLVMELCGRGTLDILLHGSPSNGGLDPNKLLPIVRSIARGMLHLHTRKPAIMHRDLKPGNLFIGHGFLIKVGDFGMARYVHNQREDDADAEQGDGSDSGRGLRRTLTSGVIGTAAYCAPELMLTDEDASYLPNTSQDRLLKADVYSFGVTLYELLTRKRPYAGLEAFQIQTQWLIDPESMKLPQIQLPTDLTGQARSIMYALSIVVEQCTSFEPEERPTFKEVLEILKRASAELSTLQTMNV